MIVADVSSPVIVEAFGEGDLTFELSRGDKYVCVVVGVGEPPESERGQIGGGGSSRPGTGDRAPRPLLKRQNACGMNVRFVKVNE